MRQGGEDRVAIGTGQWLGTHKFGCLPCVVASLSEAMGTPSDHGPVRHNRATGDDDDAVPDDVIVALFLAHVPLVDDADVPADPAVLVHDGPLDDTAVSHGEVGDALLAVR